MNNLLGKVLGNRYLLLEKIGEGGMSLVYKAKCQLLNRYVAVKILRPEFTTDEEFIKKFKRESLAAASLSHPNIVGIYDVGEQDGIYFIVMEYVNGKTLKEYIRKQGKIGYRETLEIAGKIALALENAHKNGVVHRDIKPHNILITEDGIIKVTDFGIARASTSSTMTNTGRIMGSVHYFSPEQARGGFSDHRTDIYSLGVVMYEMLTGRLPYEAESPISIAIKHIQEDFVEPSIVDPEIPESVNDIVVKCMRKDMSNRYQSAREMINDIQQAIRNPEASIHVDESKEDHTRVIPVDEIEKAIGDKKISKKRKRFWVVLITLMTLFIIGTLLTYIYNKYYIVPEVQIPQITGLKQDEARRVLEEKGLKMEVVGTRHDELEEDHVIQVVQGEGTMVKKNSTVKVILSSGPERVKIPDLRGKDRTEAEAALIRVGLVLDYDAEETKNSETVKEGLVMEQYPEADTEVILGTKVKVVISSGSAVKYTVVPVLRNKTIEEAREELKKYNLILGKIEYGQNANLIDGAIIEQSISPGKEVKEGTAINVKVNKLEPKNEDEEPGETDNTGGSGGGENSPGA